MWARNFSKLLFCYFCSAHCWIRYVIAGCVFLVSLPCIDLLLIACRIGYLIAGCVFLVNLPCVDHISAWRLRYAFPWRSIARLRNPQRDEVTWAILFENSRYHCLSECHRFAQVSNYFKLYFHFYALVLKSNLWNSFLLYDPNAESYYCYFLKVTGKLLWKVTSLYQRTNVWSGLLY